MYQEHEGDPAERWWAPEQKSVWAPGYEAELKPRVETVVERGRGYRAVAERDAGAGHRQMDYAGRYGTSA